MHMLDGSVLSGRQAKSSVGGSSWAIELELRHELRKSGTLNGLGFRA